MTYIVLTWLLAPVWWPVSYLRRLITGAPRRIVIFEIAGIGDVICSAHLFDQLRSQYPNATIDLVVDPIAATLAPALPMINLVLPFSYAHQRGLKGRLRLIKRCMSYDAGLCLIPSAAQLTSFCLAMMPWRLSVLPLPLNTSYRMLSPLMTDTAFHQPGDYFPATQMQLVKRLGVTNTSSTKKLSAFAARNTGLADVNSLPFKQLGILVGSGRPLKRIDQYKMLELVIGLTRLSPDIHVALIGGPTDKAAADKIVNALDPEIQDRIQNLAGCATLSELPETLLKLSVLIGVDSGVTHMADALGVPVVCIAGPVDLDEVYEPGEKRCLLTSGLPCYPCSRVFDTPASCYLGHRNCLQQLDVSDVLTGVKQLLESGHHA